MIYYIYIYTLDVYPGVLISASRSSKSIAEIHKERTTNHELKDAAAISRTRRTPTK